MSLAGGARHHSLARGITRSFINSGHRHEVFPTARSSDSSLLASLTSPPRITTEVAVLGHQHLVSLAVLASSQLSVWG